MTDKTGEKAASGEKRVNRLSEIRHWISPAQCRWLRILSMPLIGGTKGY